MGQKNKPIREGLPRNNNVIAFAGTYGASKRPPPLSSDEILQLRALLKKASIILSACPVARRALQDADI